LADKYVQGDLHDKCVDALIHNLTETNVWEMLDFACEHNLPLLKDWCMKIFKNGVDFDTLEQKVQALEDQKMAELETEKYQLIEKTLFEYVFENLSTISSAIAKQSSIEEIVRFYGDFLIKRMSKQNILKYLGEFNLFEKMTSLQDALLKFVYVNFNSAEQENLIKSSPYGFGMKFSEYRSRIVEEKQKESDSELSIELKKESASEGSQKDSSDKAQRKAVKRMDPRSHSSSEEGEKGDTGPTLKKTKQSDNRNISF